MVSITKEHLDLVDGTVVADAATGVVTVDPAANEPRRSGAVADRRAAAAAR